MIEVSLIALFAGVFGAVHTVLLKRRIVRLEQQMEDKDA